MHVRAISTVCLLLALGWFSGACDDKTDAKVDAKAKADEKKADEKTAETKVEEKKVDDAKVDDAKVDDAKVDDAKVDDAKVDEKKADDAKVDEKKADDKKVDEKKADDKKTDDKKSDPVAKVNAKEVFDKKCKTCHGATGNAATKVGKENDIPDWTVAGWKAKWPEAKVIDIVTNGESGTKMKAFKDKLTKDEILAVSKYARTLGK